jgi:hypothetical protein
MTRSTDAAFYMSKNFQPLIDELRAFIETSRAGRLTPADELKGATLFKDLVAAGGKALAGALDLIGDLPWFIPVNGTLEAWAGLTPIKQRNFLAALKPLESEAARRMRFSIARGLYRVDPVSALKLLLTTLQTTRTEAGLDPRDRQIFCNVLIGKNKPWLSQVELNSLKPAEANILALSALESIAGANPPAAIAVIHWAKPVKTLFDLPEPVLQELAKGFRKWSTRWQKELAGEQLPPILNDVVQSKLAKSPQEPLPDRQQSQSPPLADDVTARTQNGLPQSQRLHSPQSQPAQQRAQHPKRSQGNLPSQEDRHQRTKEHRQEKQTPQNQRRGVDLPDLLRQIETQFQNLRSELQSAKSQAKPALDQPRPVESVPFAGSNRELSKLRDENAQLAETVRELRETLSELAAENFEEALSRKADTDAPVTDPVEQYKSLLTLRLREQIVNFQELNREKHVDGLPLLLDNILHTLEENGIDLSNIEMSPPPIKRRF